MPWGKRLRLSVAEKFWSNVDKTPGQGPAGDCWQWTGARRGSRVSKQSSTYYGGMHVGSKVMLAHRISYELAYGSIPTGLGVLHRCDNPACVRPSHLWAGNHLSNVRDAWSKGRGYIPRNPARGEASGSAKLTEEKVRSLRELHATGKYTFVLLGKRFNVTPPTAEAAIKRRTWGHIQ